MKVWDKIKPEFWDYHDADAGPYRSQLDFRRVWYTAVFLTSAVVLAPLIFMTVMNYRAMRQDVESEIIHETSRLVSNVGLTVSAFLEERKTLLDFVAHENEFDELTNPGRLNNVFQNLKKSSVGFTDLSLIDHGGIQLQYVGPYHLKDRDYREQEWFKQVVLRGSFIGDIPVGDLHLPQLVIAVRYPLGKGHFFVLKAALDTEEFNDFLLQLEAASQGDAFIINHEGVLQSPASAYGKALQKLSLPALEYDSNTKVIQRLDQNGEPLIMGYRHLADTSLILMMIKKKKELMQPFENTRETFIWIFVGSVVFFLFVIISGVSYVIIRMFRSDRKLIIRLHQVEYANKMVSIGRLAAGVAHEINNPLAIINEKAGFMKDLFVFKKEYAKDEVLMGLLDSILSSVARCGGITRRLLGFARHMDVSIQIVNLGEVVQEVLAFLNKDAEFRCIEILIEVAEDIPKIQTDAGKLQQIILNIINNAFAAMEDNGHLHIVGKMQGTDVVTLAISDDGCGISEKDLKHVFEPFFSTKAGKGGTGLGLSITYGLVEQIGGSIEVRSELDKGTTFMISLPLVTKEKQMTNSCGIPSRQ